MELFEEIRREYEFGIGTIAGVAKKLRVHRRMVREAIGSALPKPRKKAERPRWKLAGGGGIHGRDSGSGSEGAAETAPHGTPDLGADASGDAGVLGLRADGSAVRPRAKNLRWAWWSRERSCRRATTGEWKRRSIGTKPMADLAGERTKLQVFCDAKHGQRSGVSLRLSARHAAGVSGSARAGVRLLWRCVSQAPLRQPDVGGEEDPARISGGKRRRGSSPSVRTGDSRASSARRRKRTRRGAWKEKPDTFAGITGCRCRRLSISPI